MLLRLTILCGDSETGRGQRPSLVDGFPLAFFQAFGRDQLAADDGPPRLPPIRLTLGGIELLSAYSCESSSCYRDSSYEVLFRRCGKILCRRPTNFSTPFGTVCGHGQPWLVGHGWPPPFLAHGHPLNIYCAMAGALWLNMLSKCEPWVALADHGHGQPSGAMLAMVFRGQPYLVMVSYCLP